MNIGRNTQRPLLLGVCVACLKSIFLSDCADVHSVDIIHTSCPTLVLYASMIRGKLRTLSKFLFNRRIFE